jgi:hypothetical protein
VALRDPDGALAGGDEDEQEAGSADLRRPDDLARVVPVGERGRGGVEPAAFLPYDVEAGQDERLAQGSASQVVRTFEWVPTVVTFVQSASASFRVSSS